ncbi:MAG: M23 family metallopeptidase [Flavobacteriaceae bacterium]|nr:M23 family metallopeptidase [Flavobacteriaceae bacterium]
MNYKNIIPLILFTISMFYGKSQQIYPTDYFQKPLNIPLVLSGNFGELRTNHFHAGLDFKTQQKEGFEVLAAAEGYISRIKISHWGYGKAIYITHPNGYTTVYGHLKKFNKTIEAYIKSKQYQKESFEIQVFPKSHELLVKKGEIIAASGATGGYVGPHLHFEIRNTKTEKPINPLLFGLKIKDTRSPQIKVLMGYPLSDDAQINKYGIPLKLNYKKMPNGVLLADKIYASGRIGFGINTFDRQDGAWNKNGIYNLKMFVNDALVYEYEVESFSFSESRQLNLLIDYKRFKDINQRVQRCFIVPKNTLSIYKNCINKGQILIEEGLSYNVKLIASDFKGNKTTLQIPIIGKQQKIIVAKKDETTQYPIIAAGFNKFIIDDVTVAFPKNTFYKDTYLDLKIIDSVAHIHKSTIPLNKKYTLTFDVSNFSKKERAHLFIAKYSSKNKPYYVKTIKKEHTFYTTSKDLGTYRLLRDEKKPRIQFLSFKENQWISSKQYLKVKISDNFSGIKKYRGEINGKWILMEYSPKTKTLTYDFKDNKNQTSTYNLKVTLIDNAGNTTVKTGVFKRKVQ